MKHNILWGALVCAFVTQAAVQTPTIRLGQKDSALLLTNQLKGADWQNARLTLSLYEGKEKKVLPAKTVITDGESRLSVLLDGNKWSWKTDFQRRGSLIFGISHFANNTGKEMWIEPGLRAAIDFQTPPRLFWDGFGKMRKLDKAPLQRLGIQGLGMEHVGSKELPFPAVALFGRQGGLQLGHRIFDPVSYSAAFCDPGKKELRFTQRFALQAGEKLTFHWVIGSVSCAFGGAEAAVQQHYDAFPERWAADQENRYIWGNSAQYTTWKSAPDDEFNRRLHQTIDWAYCPYKRAGDIACRKELWDYTPNNAYDPQSLRFGGVKMHIDKISREEFLKLRRDRYLKYGKRYGWMFYSNCAGTWCEYALAKKYYPDALNDTDPLSNHLLKKWSTHHDWELRVFPMGTSFAAAFEEDMTVLTRELDLPGFALDCGSGGIAYRGPAIQKQLPGRAWDEKGVFIDQSVAVNHVVDYIHSIRPGMTVWLNGPLKGDLIMFERDFVRTDEQEKMMPLYKWYIGPRPSLVHGHGYRFDDVVANWRNLSQQEFCETMFKLGVFQLFHQFKYGMTGAFITMCGVPDLVYSLPELFELRRAGWRSLVPVKLDGLYAPYRSAFGKGANSFLFFGNSRATESRGKITVNCDLLTDYSGETLIFVPKMRKQTALENRIAGRTTAFNAVFPPRTPVLYETVCALSSAPAKMTVEASSIKTLQKQVYTAQLTQTDNFSSRITVRPIRGFDSVLKLNGQIIDGKQETALKQGDVITAEYTSKLFALQQSDLEKFSFTDDRKQVSCRIYFAKDAPEAEAAAKRISGFFAFLQKNKVLPGTKLPEIVHDPALRGKEGVITLESKAGAEKIALAPEGGLLLGAPNGEALEKVTEKLLYQLDLRYPYVYPFRGAAGMPLPMLKHFKMNGKSLPVRNFFD